MRHTIFLFAMLATGLLGGWFAQQLLDGKHSAAGLNKIEFSRDDTALEHARKHLIPGYVCPMHPSVVSNAPGSCPVCGMDLEPKRLDVDGEEGGIAVSSAMSNSLGVRIAHAGIGRVSEQVFASGSVAQVTAAQTTEIKALITGTVREAMASVGDWVAEKDVLLAIDAPHFVTVQTEYLEALKLRDYDRVKELRIQLSDMGARKAVLDGIDRLTNKPLTPEFLLEAPHSGIIGQLLSENGAVVDAGYVLLRISTPTIARVRLRSYARAARSVVPGRRAQLDLPHLPGLTWPGRVVEVNHDDAGFYSNIEVDFEVPADAAERGLFVGAYVNAGTGSSVLRIPASSVIRAEGESRVVRLRGDGKFEPVVSPGYTCRARHRRLLNKIQ